MGTDSTQLKLNKTSTEGEYIGNEATGREREWLFFLMGSGLREMQEEGLVVKPAFPSS